LRLRLAWFLDEQVPVSVGELWLWHLERAAFAAAPKVTGRGRTRARRRGDSCRRSLMSTTRVIQEPMAGPTQPTSSRSCGRGVRP
jgi:hypothetical protein